MTDTGGAPEHKQARSDQREDILPTCDLHERILVRFEMLPYESELSQAENATL